MRGDRRGRRDRREPTVDDIVLHQYSAVVGHLLLLYSCFYKLTYNQRALAGNNLFELLM